MEPLTHKPSKHVEWNESYYFIFYDNDKKIGGMSRVGFKPNKKEGMTFFFLFLPDGSIGAYHANDGGCSYPESIQVSSVHHQCLSNGKWKYSFEGPMLIFDDPKNFAKVQENPEVITDLVGVKVDLEYAALNTVYEYSKHMTPESLEIGKKSGDMHWEQIGKVTGSMKIGDEIIEIEGCLGQRDHTHGIRDWTGVGNWFYFVIWFSKDLAVNPAAVVMNDGRIGSGGFIFKNGENIPLETINMLDHSYQEDGIFPISTTLELIDANGQKQILRARPGQMIPVPFRGDSGDVSFLIQSFGSFQLDDIEGGYGLYEVLRSLKP